MRKGSRNGERLIFFISILAFLGLIFFLRELSHNRYKLILMLVSVNFLYLIIKLLLALLYKPFENKPKKFKVSVVIPSYNESEQSVIQAIHTLVKQTYPIYEIIFIDDGSESDVGYKAVRNFKLDEFEHVHPVNKNVKITSIRLKKNSGKKKAQEVGFNKSSGDLLLLVDSDGEITEDALREMVRPFSDPKVGSVVGKIEVRNLNDSFWTKLQDIIYSNSFQLGRASQSVTNSVIVCSGALSMHRSDFVKKNMKTFKKEKFFGIPCTAGDDRLLTDISLEKGYKTVYQSTAICYTDVPQILTTFFKQQVRWSKSALIMTLFSFRYCYLRPLAILWQVFETYLWLYNLIVLLFMIAFGHLSIHVGVLIVAIAYFILVSYLGNIFYTKRKFRTYLIVFIYSFCYSFVLLGIRIYALITVFKTGWSTR